MNLQESTEVRCRLTSVEQSISALSERVEFLVRELTSVQEQLAEKQSSRRPAKSKSAK